MNRQHIAAAVSLLLILASVTTPLRAQESNISGTKTLESLMSGYRQSQSKLDAPIDSFNAHYDAKLADLENKAAKSGHLDLVIAIQKERKSYATSPSQIDRTATELVQLRAVYDRHLTELKTERDNKFRILTTNLRQKLLALQNSLTRSGGIDEAVLVRDAIAKLPSVETSAKTTPNATEPLVPSENSSDDSRVRTIEFAAPDKGERLSPVEPGDGKFRLHEVRGHVALHAIGRFLYFQIDDDFAFDLKADNRDRFTIIAELFEESGGKVGIQFDGYNEADSPEPWCSARIAKLGGSRKWTKLEFKLERPRFANSQHQGADFRLASYGPERLILRKIVVERKVR